MNVVGAVIRRDELILCAQRGPGGGHAGLWEFPGGKVEPGETHQQALMREIAEELGCHITVGNLITVTDDQSGSTSITLHTYECTITSGEPAAHEHARIAWLHTDELMTLQWAPADIPTVERIQAMDASTSP